MPYVLCRYQKGMFSDEYIATIQTSRGEIECFVPKKRVIIEDEDEKMGLLEVRFSRAYDDNLSLIGIHNDGHLETHFIPRDNTEQKD